jgi:(2R)-ethylmalonyl-CoA mutase
VPDTVGRLREAGVDAPVVVGGIIPDADRPGLAAAGVAAVYTPRDFRLDVIVADLIDLATAHRRQARDPARTA